jgi:hypothetical protein
MQRIEKPLAAQFFFVNPGGVCQRWSSQPPKKMMSEKGH